MFNRIKNILVLKNISNRDKEQKIEDILYSFWENELYSMLKKKYTHY